MKAFSLSYVVPVHNECATLERNVRRLAEHLASYPGSRILLVENGSRDESWPLCQQLANTASSDCSEPKGDKQASPGVEILAYQERNAGLGYAWHRGTVEEIARADHSRWVALTAADLPFGFTDLDGVLNVLRSGLCPDIIIGSKAHRESTISTTPVRTVATLGYRVLRRLIGGMHTGDSQGTFFFTTGAVASLMDQMVSRDFFWSTELAYRAERAGKTIVEVPVTLEEQQRASTVKPFKHGIKMLRQLVELRLKDAGL
jgi:glycosyltransferase involved in cell wall biosynthesis